MQALSIAREIGDARSEAIHLGNVGTVYKGQRNFEKAIDHFRQSIAISREIENQPSVAIQLGNTGDALCKLERHAEAETAFRQAISIGDEAFPIAGGVFRASLALLLARQRRYDNHCSSRRTKSRQLSPKYRSFSAKKDMFAFWLMMAMVRMRRWRRQRRFQYR